MSTKLRAKLSFANVAASIALFLSLSTGAAYASHELIFSSDIVNGQVKRADIAPGAVVRTKLAGNAVTGPKILDGSVTGSDVAEPTLVGVDATSLGGYGPHQLVEVGDSSHVSVIGLPDCDPGIDYMARSITVPRDGWVVVNASFTAGRPAVADKEPIAIRIERTVPTLFVGEWREDTMESGGGRYNLSLTEVFPVAQGTNDFVLKVCDGSDFTASGSGVTVRAHMTILYTPFGLSLN